jgi:hypothetical protein
MRKANTVVTTEDLLSFAKREKFGRGGAAADEGADDHADAGEEGHGARALAEHGGEAAVIGFCSQHHGDGAQDGDEGQDIQLTTSMPFIPK